MTKKTWKHDFAIGFTVHSDEENPELVPTSDIGKSMIRKAIELYQNEAVLRKASKSFHTTEVLDKASGPMPLFDPNDTTEVTLLLSVEYENIRPGEIASLLDDLISDATHHGLLTGNTSGEVVHYDHDLIFHEPHKDPSK